MIPSQRVTEALVLGTSLRVVGSNPTNITRRLSGDRLAHGGRQIPGEGYEAKAKKKSFVKQDDDKFDPSQGKMKNLSGGQNRPRLRRRVHVVLPAHRRFDEPDETWTATISALARHQGVPGRRAHDFAQRRVLRRHCPRGLGGARRPEGAGFRRRVDGGREGMELAEAKAKKKSIPKQDDDNSTRSATRSRRVSRYGHRSRLRQETYEAAQGPQGAGQEGRRFAEDEMYEVEEQLDKANAILKKEKEARTSA